MSYTGQDTPQLDFAPAAADIWGSLHFPGHGTTKKITGLKRETGGFSLFKTKDRCNKGGIVMRFVNNFFTPHSAFNSADLTQPLFNIISYFLIFAP